MICENCGFEFDPVRTRWICPACKLKAHCCEGMPMQPRSSAEIHQVNRKSSGEVLFDKEILNDLIG